MDELKNILKVSGFLMGGLLLFYLFFFKLVANQEEVEDVVLEECLPLQYDFRVISYEEGRYYDIEGRTKEGRYVKFKVPRHWELEGVCTEGDSIHKLAGEKELYLIKSDTILKFPLKVQGEEI